MSQSLSTRIAATFPGGSSISLETNSDDLARCLDAILEKMVSVENLVLSRDVEKVPTHSPVTIVSFGSSPTFTPNTLPSQDIAVFKNFTANVSDSIEKVMVKRERNRKKRRAYRARRRQREGKIIDRVIVQGASPSSSQVIEEVTSLASGPEKAFEKQFEKSMVDPATVFSLPNEKGFRPIISDSGIFQPSPFYPNFKSEYQVISYLQRISESEIFSFDLQKVNSFFNMLASVNTKLIDVYFLLKKNFPLRNRFNDLEHFNLIFGRVILNMYKISGNSICLMPITMFHQLVESKMKLKIDS